MIMKILSILFFYFLYWGVCVLCTGSDKKNLTGLRSYPDIVREKLLQQENISEILPKEKSLISIFIGNLMLFSLVFSLYGIMLKKPLNLTNFRSAFLYFIFLGEGLGLFDLLIIDLLWWRNTERIRFSFLPQKSYYQDPQKHIASFLRGIPMFVLVSLISAIAVTRI